MARALAALLPCLLAPCASGAAQAATAPPALSQFALQGAYESWRLPGHEAMGMVAVGVRQHFGEHLRLGVDVYGAVRGERGGFITLGGYSGLEFSLAPQLSLETGLFIGAGGGRGGRELSGGGLMLRGNIGLHYLAGPVDFTAGVSQVDFPNGGIIRSTQAYVGAQLPFRALLQPGGITGSPATAFTSATLDLTGYTPHPQAFGVVLREIDVSPGVSTDNGRPQQNFSLIGAEWRTFLGPHAFTRIEASAAMRGGVAGYMQVMSGGGLHYPLSKRLDAHGSLSVGFGGGGGVNTAGGLLAAADLGLQYALQPHWLVEVGAGYFTAPHGALRAKTYTLRVAHGFGEPAAPGAPAFTAANSSAPANASSTGHYTARAVRVRFAEQHYFQGSDDWRSLPALNVGTLGFQFDYFMTPEWYLTGQGLGAYTGQAGAYMTGQLGLGTHRALTNRTFVELEALTGAAGGGGLHTGSGLVLQLNANLGWQATDRVAVLLGLGEMQAANGPFRAHVAGVSVAYRFNALQLTRP